MLNWEQIVHQYLSRYANSIKKVTKPLRERFGVEFFNYHRIDLDGTYTVLLDRPDWAERYVSQEIYRHDPYLRDPRVYQTGLSMIDMNGSEEYLEQTLNEAKDNFAMDFGAIYIHRTETSVEFFGFSGTKKNKKLTNLCLNHPNLLTSFGRHFKEQMHPILQNMQDENIHLPTLTQNNYKCPTPIISGLESTLLSQFLQDIGLGNILEMAKLLTPQEKKCLIHLLDGNSSKATAAHMSLSARTVESYLENIKQKLNCWNKQELFAIARKLHELKLL